MALSLSGIKLAYYRQLARVIFSCDQIKRTAFANDNLVALPLDCFGRPSVRFSSSASTPPYAIYASFFPIMAPIHIAFVEAVYLAMCIPGIRRATEAYKPALLSAR
ncbi:TPA: hypothetical protein IHM15_004507 [Escherichia coli]|nr:hypothetical protein [Escherichia coli]